jgi:YidC/Oxa1 family membrane protein insertase
MDFLSNIMLDALRFFAYFGGYGWGIVWLTIAVNLALYPLTLSSISSMSAIQKIQPRLQEIQKKYKDQPQELQKQTLDLYRSEKINPAGGCLPVLLKIPFFLALFWALQSQAFYEIASSPENETGFLWINGKISANEIGDRELVKKLSENKLIVRVKKSKNEEYVWNAAKKMSRERLLKDELNGRSEEKVGDIKAVKESLGGKFEEKEIREIMIAWNRTNDLGKPERVNTPFGIISILAILIGISTYFMQATMPAQANSQMQMMTIMMPVLLVFICWSFPAGVQVYWLVSNVIGAIQQYYILKLPKKGKGRV